MSDELANILLLCGLGILAVIFMFLPIIIAGRREHPSIGAIAICCVVGFVIWPLWLVALIWACAGITQPQQIVYVQQSPTYAFPVASQPTRKPLSQNEKAARELERMTGGDQG